MLAPSGGRLHLHACSRGPEGGGGGLSTLSGAVLLEPSTLPVGDYSLSKSIYDSRTSTRAPHVSAAPVRCRKVVYPGGCTARPGSSHVLQSAAPTGPSP